MGNGELVVMATQNPGKIAEIQVILQHSGKKVVPQSEFFPESADETGLTFVENAILKARYASQCTGLPALADDSGLEVNALRGAPGIYSARYAGPNASDQDNIEKLLAALDGQDDRGARFWCALVYLRHADDPCPVICQASWAGRILNQPSGQNGFGYDPVFQPQGMQCSAAELSRTEKNLISHRGQALKQLEQAFSLNPSCFS